MTGQDIQQPPHLETINFRDPLHEPLALYTKNENHFMYFLGFFFLLPS